MRGRKNSIGRAGNPRAGIATPTVGFKRVVARAPQGGVSVLRP
jgi:hypothetical protein